MLSKEFLIKQTPVLKPTDTGTFALAQMEDYKLKHLPIVDNGIYMCLLSEKDVFLMTNMEDVVANVCIYSPYAGVETPLLEVLRIMSKDQLTLLPVLNDLGKYIGAITQSILIEKLAEVTNAGLNGSVIAIELNQQDYELSAIIKLAESNNARVLTMLTYPNESIAKIVVLLKIDLEDASTVLRSLERFNFQIIYYSQKDGIMDDIQRRRLDELMYYLEM